VSTQPSTVVEWPSFSAEWEAFQPVVNLATALQAQEEIAGSSSDADGEEQEEPELGGPDDDAQLQQWLRDEEDGEPGTSDRVYDAGW